MTGLGFVTCLQESTHLGCFPKFDAIYLAGFVALSMEKTTVFHFQDCRAEPPVPGLRGPFAYSRVFRKGLETFWFRFGFSLFQRQVKVHFLTQNGLLSQQRSMVLAAPHCLFLLRIRTRTRRLHILKNTSLIQTTAAALTAGSLLC